MNSCVEEVYELEHVRTYTELLCVILYNKYLKEYLNEVVKNQCQHLKEIQQDDLLKLLQKFEELFDVTLGTWEIDPVYFELEDGMKPIFLIPYPVPKLH